MKKASATTLDDISPIFDNQNWFPIEELYSEAKELYLARQFWSCIILCWDIIELSLRLSFYIESEQGSKTYTYQRVDRMTAQGLIDNAVKMRYITKQLGFELNSLRRVRNSFTHYKSVIQIGDDKDRVFFNHAARRVMAKLGNAGIRADKDGLAFRAEFRVYFDQRLKEIARNGFKTTTRLLSKLFPVQKPRQ